MSRNELILRCRERRSGNFRLDGLRLALTGRARQGQSTVTKVLKAEEEHMHRLEVIKQADEYRLLIARQALARAEMPGGMTEWIEPPKYALSK